MIKKILKNKFIVVLILIVVILIIIKIFSKNSVHQPLQTSDSISNTPTLTHKNSTAPTPKIIPNSEFSSFAYPTLTPKQQTITEINYEIPLSQLLPYQGKYFIASRYLEVHNLEIIVYDKSKTDLAKKEAQEWLFKNGVGDLDLFTVVYK